MPHHDNARGIFMMLVAISLLACMDAGLKQLSGHYPALQVTALRALASWPLVAVWALWSVGARGLTRVRWGLQLARGALFVVTLTSFIVGVRHLPLSTAYTLFFISPLVITLLASTLLGEKADRHRWGVIVVGFAGVLVALRPTGEGAFTWAGLSVLAAAVGYSLAAITARVLGRTDSTQSMLFWTLTLMAPAATALAWPRWVAVSADHWWIIAGIGTLGAVGQYALTEAFARGEPSVIAPFEYSALAWGLGFDVMLWGVLPDGYTFAGAAIIIASGLYLIRRERFAAPAATELQP